MHVQGTRNRNCFDSVLNGWRLCLDRVVDGLRPCYDSVVDGSRHCLIDTVVDELSIVLIVWFIG